GLGYYGALDEFRILARSTDEHVAKSWTDSELLLGILKREKGDRLSSESQALTDFFIANEATPEIRQAHSDLQAAKRQQRAARGAIATTLVMQERKEPRSTFVLLRGVYDARGEEVKPAVPAVLAPTGVATRPDRLGLAQWLTSKDHPLTARVAVNRFWQICFGEGLVRTPNDFGTQGESPTHPELLDELAVRWMHSGWDMKQLLRWIVTSATYRQSSQGTDESLKKDPENRWLSRGPRFRLSAELVRDQALAVSGLWATKVGGPSVRPYQPEGVWEAVSYNAEDSYQPDRGEGLWRRSLYTYWKRQAPPPALQVFDAGTREKCLIKRPRTNTPLQALVLLNDPTYLTAASALASQSLSQFPTKGQRISAMFRQVLSRWPESIELQALSDLHDREIAILKNSPQLVQELTSATVTNATSAGATMTNSTTVPRPVGSTAVDLAAYTLVAHTIMNLDEAITRR
ncbi:MAG: DUF1553 domain-containing protein, partial [Pirellulaceae bacterium]|nr:DUF1553 domain-containing protein [Pirellulaceae bacterium]